MATIDQIQGYHAHVYYDPPSRAAAAALRDALAESFEAELGRWHDAPIGPHPCGSYQIAFGPELFANLVPWLALNRGDLTVFVHPNTGEALADHTAHVIWLGESRALNLDALR
ncbi:MAG: DOPA 4,5-dioxygenase family protein [Burkholderiales bacterium]